MSLTHLYHMNISHLGYTVLHSGLICFLWISTKKRIRHCLRMCVTTWSSILGSLYFFFIVFLIGVVGTDKRQKSFQSLEWVKFCKTCFFILRIYFWSKQHYVQFLPEIQIWRHFKLPQNDKFVLPELCSVFSADRIFSRV